MRRHAIALLAVLLLAGCASPQGPPAEEGPVDLTGRLGLMLVDVEGRRVVSFSETSGLAWMSANGTFVTWTEETFSIVLDRSSGERDVRARNVWARVYENGTGLELAEGQARWRSLANNSVLASVPVPAPPPGASWTAASDDLAVLGSESDAGRRAACAHDIILRAQRVERTFGCHLRVSADGRAAWSENGRVRVRAADGAIENLTLPDGGADASVAYENPVFTEEGILLLRVAGGSTVAVSEVVDADGNALARMDGPRRLALHDASADGNLLLVRAFR